jgi:prolyl-tRNA synthetase
MKGVPVRIALGNRDLENGTVEVARRDTLTKEVIQQSDLTAYVSNLMTVIQDSLLSKNKAFVEEKTTVVTSWEEFQDAIENKGGFVSAHWDGTSETELKIKEATKATIRCIPFDSVEEDGKCIFSGNPSSRKVLFAKAY